MKYQFKVTMNTFCGRKSEATNDENDGVLGGATKLCRQKKDKANKEGPSDNKPKV